MNASWRRWPITRIAGSFVSWFLFATSFGLLLQLALVVLALGGSCASGGPYPIAVECPENIGYVPLSIWVGLGSVALSLVFSGGFGVPLTSWAWPVLFVGLGGAFLSSFVLGGDLVGLIIGVMFVVMGLVPLVIELRASAQRVFLGQFSADGQQFAEGDRARRGLMSRTPPNPEGAIPPTAAHWALALGIPGAAIALGVWAATSLV